MNYSRENVPSSRADLSMTGTCGAIPWVLTSQSEVGCRTISRVGHEPFRFDAETCFGPLDHCLRGADLSLTNGPRGLDIHDDPALYIDKIIVGVGKERGIAQRARPLRGRVRR